MIDVWVIFALLGVLGKTAYYALQKRLLDDSVSSIELGYISSFYGFLALAPIGGYMLVTNPPDVSWHVYAIVMGLGAVELVGLLMYLRALALCDLSLASPLKKMKPGLVALFEPIVLGTPFSLPLLAAATSTGIGGYVVLMKDSSLLAPFKRLTEPGPALAFATAFVYAGLSLGSRFGASNLSPYIYGFIVFSVMFVGYTALMLHRDQMIPLKSHFSREYLAVGSTGVGRSLTVWIAYSLAAATMVSVVSQLTIILDVVVGGALLKEGNTKQRLAGAAMILAGVVAVMLI